MILSFDSYSELGIASQERINRLKSWYQPNDKLLSRHLDIFAETKSRKLEMIDVSKTLILLLSLNRYLIIFVEAFKPSSLTMQFPGNEH